MSSKQLKTTDSSFSEEYQIRVKGHIGNQWSDWFEGLAIKRENNGDTVLTGLVIDQAALFGLLKKVRDLGMPLLSVSRTTPGLDETTNDNETFETS